MRGNDKLIGDAIKKLWQSEDLESEDILERAGATAVEESEQQARAVIHKTI
jgi:hypothetical protein